MPKTLAKRLGSVSTVPSPSEIVRQAFVAGCTPSPQAKPSDASIGDLLPSQQPLDPSSATARAVSEEEILLRLQQAILRLPQKQQLAFNLRYYEDMSYDEIARVIGSSPSSAKANYHLAKERIMKYLNEND